MKNIVKTVSILTIISLIPAAFAATSRVGVTNKASARLPSIAGYMVSSGTALVSTGTTSTTYYNDQECYNKYTDCIKADDACGANMEECTTNVLFHAQMPKCLNVLYQCSAAGVNQLFGTSAINALSNVASYKTVDGVQEVDRYTYPTDGSALGQMIIGAAEANKLTKDQCVRRYTSCLKRDDNCGADFELCTTNKEFRRQAVLCDSTLKRCDNTTKQELFGSVGNADSLTPSETSRLGEMITEGASLAAGNAINTCEKVVDNCLYSACVENPWRCVAGTNTSVIDTADFVVGAGNYSTTVSTTTDEVRTESQIRKILKDKCLTTVGGNKYCHMTYLEKVPTAKELADRELQEDVFAQAYNARKSAVNTRIQAALTEFDKNIKDKCVDTIKSCAMRSCGGGLGSVCYRQARLDGRTNTTSRVAYGDVHVNGENTRDEIRSGCMAIINADANCQYAAASASATDSYAYTYTKDSTFDTLFPVYNSTTRENDPIGAVGTLNALLATSYNEAAIETMKKQCETVALSCVKSMCGKDYVNCYRARTDIVSGSYDTGNGKFDRSMNKVGGVLDYNIVLGLCMNTVKNSSVCDEHLKVATADWRRENADNEIWGGASSVREGWLGANTTTENKSTYGAQGGVLISCRASNELAAASATIDNVFGANTNCSGTMEPINGACVGVMDEDGCVYDTPVYMGETEFVMENAGKSLFQQLLADVEKEVQAKYNAKLTKERNMCLGENNGGIMGTGDMGSVYQWVKLKSNKIPKNYVYQGLQAKDFTASNDLYGSFCRVRVTVMSDDKDIQDELGSDATAYFAIGDTFTCGSWISNKTLQKISDKVGKRELCKQGYGKWENGECNDKKQSTKEQVAYAWATVAPALVGGVAGFAGMDAIQNKNGSLGGLLKGEGSKRTEEKATAADNCLDEVDESLKYYNNARLANNSSKQESEFSRAIEHANKALRYARSAGVADSLPAFETLSGRDYYVNTESTSKSVWNEDDEALAILARNRINQLGDKNCGTKCQDHLKNFDEYMKNVNKTNGYLAIAKLGDAKKECGDNCKDVAIPEQLRVDAATSTTVKDEGWGKNWLTEVNGEEFNGFATKLDEVRKACENVKSSETEDDRKERRNANLIAGGVMAAASAALGAGITASVIKTKKENIKNEAAQQWMSEVGDHIMCYIGAQELGTYGDPVAVEME